MRVTITFAVGVAAVRLTRNGLSKKQATKRFRQQTYDMGEGIDYSNVADAIETLDGPASR
ncbi:hypothetical protein [Mycobacterium lacus]|uniref:Uncharacterized protein n=1 Tax=Mycobacterium lacus TaxID=169765 RepID=A0A1X1XYC8_9MYCO|nr:hypothetical protein AWC15_04950 [Mycobacterium lacus]BBX96839.1 hypothetical protein MLAC_21330 [Mycobacterium lacus]